MALYICTVRKQRIIAMASKLTERQQQILDLIRQTVARTGFPPTRAEIAQALGFRSPTRQRITSRHWPAGRH